MKSVLTREEEELAAIAAAVAATCQPCLKHHYAKARELNISDERIKAAAAIGRGVRATPEKHIDELCAQLTGGEVEASATACCG
ncbi:carboxymuconolactone decarboxylase family protein [Rhizomicrobium electricum]|jgi:AhpD family alkylhydroperoxidase|uniref:Carboxymuconolactone decarboxylase-like domain-containing protein n=1 Tax=Rhizomicrobium electricum TaxID=480070 RepID=A0ABN1F8B6_9PROT|nr:carboxymuconolactone decarboxylase family protein [Rhizomicrobium electricum]NIJ46757.1 AhpD family alkylhydroperoxidase [Rhizomicrobium electricum]